jgi:non-specific serine/threonine protein kinase
MGEPEHADVAPAGDHPTRIGPFTVLECLGESMGRVYRCLDPHDGVVILKCVASSRGDSPDRLRRLAQETDALVRLRGHPHIVHVHTTHEFDGLRYIETEFIPGQDLSATLLSDAFGPREALATCLQVARGLEAAHAARVLHRDLKPRNVRITPEGVAKIIDFGLAKLVSEGVDPDAPTRSEALTSPGQMLGTPGYMSPEQVHAAAVDEGADIWGLGCVLYECLAKHPAFRGPTLAAVLVSSLNDEPMELPEETPGRELALWCLRKDRRDRPVSMREVRVALESAMARASGGSVGAGARGASTATSRGAPHNLPRRLASFVGRGEEMASIRGALTHGRVAVLTGVGGCGKSRLAIESGWEQLPAYPDGVWFVELAPIAEDRLVAPALAAVLKVEATGGASVEHAIASRLGPATSLVILDNCEHVAPACVRLSEALLDRCPNVRVLGTSREGLGVTGEKSLRLRALAVPHAGTGPDPASLLAYPAIDLFVQRARLASEGFELTPENAGAVARICGRLDGLPLAINLVASAAGSMSVDDMAEHVDALTGTMSEGGQTIEGSIGLSYRRLSPAQQRMLQRLSVFEGGWTLQAAAAVCAEDTPTDDGRADRVGARDVLRELLHLVHASMVEFRQGASAGPGGRYELLQMVRAFARSRLEEAGDELRAEAVDRFAAYVCDLAARAEPHLRESAAPAWLDTLAREHENIRSAMRHLLARGTTDGAALRLVLDVHRYCYIRSHKGEAREWLGEALSRRPGARDTLQARAWNALGTIEWGLGEFGAAADNFQRSIDTFRSLGDTKGAAKPLHNQALVLWKLDRLDESARRFEELIATHDGADEGSLGVLRLHLGCVRYTQKAYEEAEVLFADAARTLREPPHLAHALHNLGETSYMQGMRTGEPRQFQEAVERLTRARTVRAQVKDPQGIARTLTWLGMAYVRLGKLAEGHSLLQEAAKIRADAALPVPAEDQVALGQVMIVVRGAPTGTPNGM